MYIREATLDDNDELIELQAKCPQGTTIVVSTVNTPDFFTRAKVYEDYRVFAVCEDSRIIASAACGLRKAVINNNIEKVGHEFQAFVDPVYRGRRIAGQLHQVRQEYLLQQGSILSYGIIIEANSIKIFFTGRKGFNFEIHPQALCVKGSIIDQIRKSAQVLYRIMEALKGGHSWQFRNQVSDIGTVVDQIYGDRFGYKLKHRYIRLHNSLNTWISSDGKTKTRMKIELTFDELNKISAAEIVRRSEKLAT